MKLNDDLQLRGKIYIYIRGIMHGLVLLPLKFGKQLLVAIAHFAYLTQPNIFTCNLQNGVDISVFGISIN